MGRSTRMFIAPTVAVALIVVLASIAFLAQPSTGPAAVARVAHPLGTAPPEGYASLGPTASPPSSGGPGPDPGLAARSPPTPAVDRATGFVSASPVPARGMPAVAHGPAPADVALVREAPVVGSPAVASANRPATITAGPPGTATYAVTFTESGLPSGSAWGVTINGSLYFGPTGSPISTDLPDGPFTYTISDIPGWHQTTIPYSGTGQVSGGPVNEPTLVFVPVAYPVTFNETGLPGDLSWSVMIDGTLYTASSGDLITTDLPNGSFSYTITDVPGWHQATLPYSGSGSIHGAPVNEPVLFFAAVLYSVTFLEGGMPTAAGGGVVFNGSGTVPFGRGGSLTFSNLTNGSYSYAIAAGMGYELESPAPRGTATVAGADLTVLVTFAIPYRVTFTETGMPISAGGGVSFNGAASVRFGSGGVVSFTEPNGSYAFEATAGPGYQWLGSDPNSPASVDGANVTVEVTFEAVYGVTFTESGMPTSAGGGVSFSEVGVTPFGLGGSVTLLAPNGTHPFFVTPGAGYELLMSSPASPLTVAGAPLPVTVAFEAVFPVTFVESGMPPSAGGGVSFAGGALLPFGDGGVLTFTEPNGSYPFIVSPAPGYRIVGSVPASPVLVDGSGVTVTTALVAVYLLTFTETGMPASAGGLSFNGAGVVPFGHGGVLSYVEENGSYPYSVTAGPGYALVASNPGSPVVVLGANVNITIHVESVYALTIYQTGLANGTRWTAELTLEGGSSSAPITEGVTGPSWSVNSTTNSAVLELGNGTYAFLVTAPGYQPVTGTATVNGHSSTASVALQPTAAPGTPGWLWAALGAGIAAVAAAAGVLFLRARGRKGSKQAR